MVLNQGIKFKFEKQVQTTAGNENGGLKATDDAIKNDSQLQTIFQKIDKGTDGKGANDGVLTDEEIQRFMKRLADAAGKDGKLSKHEAKKFLKSLGIENADPKALYRFIQTVQAKSANIKNCTMNENGDIIIESEDGNTEETIHSDKTSELKTTDENQNVTTQYKNAAGAVYKKEVKNPDGTTTITEYEMEGDKPKTDAGGNPVVSKETVVNTETNKTTVISYQNGKKVKSEEKDNSTYETTVIEFDEDGSPKTKTVTKGCVEEQYEYVNGKELLKQKIEDKGVGISETTNYEYDALGNCTQETKNTPTEQTVTTYGSNGDKTEVITEKDAYGNLTQNVTTNTLNSNGNKLSQTKTVDGTTYSVEYDGNGNTKIIVQNGESPAAIAEKFGCTVEELFAVNKDNLNGRKYFLASSEIVVPGELDADDQRLQNRDSKETVIAKYQAAEAERQAKTGEEIARGDNDYYVTKDSSGNLHFWNDKKKEISEEEFKTACPTIHKIVTEKNEAEKRGATKRTHNKYGTETIRKEAGELAEVIHNQIQGASLNEKTKNRLRAITPENAAFVVQEYQLKYDVSLAKDIDDEWGLDVDTVKEFVCEKLAQQLKNLGIKITKDYTEYSTLKGLEQWIDVDSKAIIKKMENATETYYATDTEETERTQQAEAKQTAKTSAAQIVDDLIKSTKGWNDIDEIKAAVARIDSPEELEEVNRLLALNGYPPTDKYSAIENFIYQEANHSVVHTYNSSDYLEQTVQNWIDNGTLKGQAANEAQARMAVRVIFDGGDGFGTDCEKIKKGVRMIKCPKPTGDTQADNAQAREVYKLVDKIIQKHRTFYGLGRPSNNLVDYCDGEMWDSEVKYLKGILAENEAITGEEKAQAVADLTQEAVEGAGTDIEYLEQAIKGISTPEERKAVETKLKEYCQKKGIKPQIEGQSYLQAILYDECDTFLGISTDHKEIRKFNEMLIEQGVYTEEETVNLRAEQAALQILEGNFNNIKDAVEQIKDPAVLNKVNELLKTKGYTSLDQFLSQKLNQTNSDLINAELASNNLLEDEKAANVAFRLIKNSDFDKRAMGIRAIRTEAQADLVDKKLQREGSSLAAVMEQFNKEKAEYKEKAELWDGSLVNMGIVGIIAEEISDAYRENTDSSDNLYVETEQAQRLTDQQKASYKMTVDIMEQKLAQMEKDYQAARDSQGVVSWGVNRFCEQYGIGTTREEIEARIEHDKETVRLLKQAAEGKLGKTVNGKTVAVSFEEVFKERNAGTNFDTAKVEKVQNQAETLVAMNYAKTNIAVCWEELENGLNSSDTKRLTVAITDTLEKLSAMTGKQLSLAGYGYSVKNSVIVDSNGKSVSVNDLTTLANHLKQGLSDISKELLGSGIPLNTSSDKMNKLLEKAFDSKKESFKQEFKDAFGADCPDEMIENYISTIETGKMVANIGVMIGAAIAAPFTGGGSLAMFAMVGGASLGLNALEHSTDADGWTNSEWTSDVSQAMWDGALAVVGMKVGQIAETFAKGGSAVVSQNKWLAKIPESKIADTLKRAESFAAKIQNYAGKIGEKELLAQKNTLLSMFPDLNVQTAEKISVILVRAEACGFEVTSDSLQSLVQTYCQYGEFDEEAFLRDLIISAAANSAGHIAGAAGDIKQGAKDLQVADNADGAHHAESDGSAQNTNGAQGADNARHAENDAAAQGTKDSQGADGAQKSSAGEQTNGTDNAQHTANNADAQGTKNSQGAEAKQHMSKEEYKKLDDEIRNLEDEINRLKSAAPKKGGNLSAEQVKEYKQVLGIPDNVELTEAELRRAYRKKTLKCHPDRGGSTEAMKKVNEANDELKKFLNEGGGADNNAKLIAEKEAKLKELKAEKQRARDQELHRFEAETNEKITNLSDGEEFIIGRNDSFALGEVDARTPNSRQQIKVKKQNGQYIFENIGLNDCKFTDPDGKTITASGSMNGASGGIKFSKPGKYTIEFPDGTKMQVDIPEPSKNAGGTSKSSAGEQTNGNDNAQHTANNADAQGVKDSQGSDNARHAENDAAAQGTKNSQGADGAQHANNDADAQGVNNSQSADGAQNAGHAENAKAAAEDVKKSVNDIPESGIPAQNRQLWNKCKNKIDEIINDLQSLKPDLGKISKKMSALFDDIENIAMTASREVKAQLKALKTKIENMFEAIGKSSATKNHLTQEQVMQMKQIDNNINSARSLDDLNKAEQWLKKMPDCEQKTSLQAKINAKRSEISTDAPNAAKPETEAHAADAPKANADPAEYDEVEIISVETPEDMIADSIREIDNKINAANSVSDIIEIQKRLEIDSALKNNQECWSKLYQKCKDMGFPDSQIAALKRASLCRQINNVHKNGSEIVDLINKNPKFESVITDLALNSKRNCKEIEGLLEWIKANPDKADVFTELAKSNFNIKFGKDINGNYSETVSDIGNAINNYPQYKKEIVEYMSIQRYGDMDKRNPADRLYAFIETLEKHSDKKNIILQLSKNPNMDGGTIWRYMNKYHDQMSKLQDVVFLSNKGYSEQGINGIMYSMEKQPGLRKIYMSESPKYDLIDKNPAETPTDIIEKRFKIREKLKDSFSDEMETLRKTLGNDFFVKVKWEDIIPEGAADSEIKNILSALNDESKFFARTAGNERRYGKNIRWAHEMGIISDAATYRLRNGDRFEDVIGNIANDYRQYDVATTRASNCESDAGMDRRVHSGEYRGDLGGNDEYGASTGFGDYPSYEERLTAMNGVTREYKGIQLTEIGEHPARGDGLFMLHPNDQNVKKAMPIIEKMHKNLEPYIKKVNQGKTLSESEIKKVHEQVAEIYFLMANVMPWSRGSNGIADIYMRSLYKSMNIDMPALKPDVSLDLESFCMDVNEYKTKWLSFFEK